MPRNILLFFLLSFVPLLLWNFYLSILVCGLFLTTISIFQFKEYRKNKLKGMLLPFSLIAVAGVLLVILGGVYYWPDRPILARDTVVFHNDISSAKNYSSFNQTWQDIHRAGKENWATLSDFYYQSTKNYWLTDRYLRIIDRDKLFFSYVVPVLKQFPKHPGNKNIFMYKSRFPELGPIYVQAGEYKVKFVIEFEDYISDVDGKLHRNHWQYWKIDDIAQYADVKVPEAFEYCTFGVFCWLPEPASNFK